MSNLQPHRFANYFPMMTAPELEALAADIKENGLRHPIVLYDKQILDGRNRHHACRLAGVEPTFITHEGDEASARALVISLNVRRRNMTPAKRAVAAARALPDFEEDARQRMLTGKSADGEAGGRRRKKTPVTDRDRGSDDETPVTDHDRGFHRAAADVAAIFDVGINSVSQTNTLSHEAPDLLAQIEEARRSSPRPGPN